MKKQIKQFRELPKQLHHRFSFLLMFLLAILLIYPYVPSGTHMVEGEILRFLFIGVFASAVYALSDTRSHLVVGLVLVIPIIALNIAGIIVEAGFMEKTRLALSIVFDIYAIYIILRFIFERSERVTVYTIRGAACVYLLMGITWAMIYTLIEMMLPGSFIQTQPGCADSVLRVPDFLYFSFITLTTLGYGDILPVTLQAQSMCLLEAVTGILYTTILVARLVGTYLVHIQQETT